MTECEQMADAAEQNAPGSSMMTQSGVIQGIPGKHVEVNGVLDLRGVPAEQVAGIESLRVNGIVLMDEANRGSLAQVRAEINGTTMVADPELRIMIQPDIELSRAMVQAMPAGQKLMLIGNIFVKPEVPPALLAEKFDKLHIVGIVVACEGVHGALFGKAEIVGISITLPDDVGPLVRSIGENTWTEEYLARLAEGVTYINIGQTVIPAGATEEIVARKIAAYHNVGQTVGPQPVLALLKTRCPTNLGQFSSSDEEEGE